MLPVVSLVKENEEDNLQSSSSSLTESTELDKNFPWTLIEAYFYQNNDPMKQLVNHQIESYNYFVDVQLKNTIEMFNPSIIRPESEYDSQAKDYLLEMELNFLNIQLKPPELLELNGISTPMTPKLARLRNLNYASEMTFDLHIKVIVRKKEDRWEYYLPSHLVKDAPPSMLDLLAFLSHPKYTLQEKYQQFQAYCPNEIVGGLDGLIAGGADEPEPTKWLSYLTQYIHPQIQMKQMTKEQQFFNILHNLKIGTLDIMVKSKLCVMNAEEECEFETGGYFIVKGSEKVVLAQERNAENQILCYHNKNDKHKKIWTAEIKSVPDNKCISPKQLILFISDKTHRYRNAIYVEIPRIKKPIPLFVLFRVFGVLSDKDICKLICSLDDHEMLDKLQDSIQMGAEYLTQESALQYFSSNMNYFQNAGEKYSKKQEYLHQLIKTDIFPHTQNKKEFLGYMTNSLLLRVLRRAKPDDRDAANLLRYESTGVLLNNLLRNYYNKLNKDIIKNVIKEIKVGCWRANQDYLAIINKRNIYKLIKPGSIDFHNALGTGNFGLKSINSNKVGVAQVLNRLGPLSKFSHLRRTSKPIDKNGKLIQPRKLHNTSWGMICPVETPEGHAVGIVKNIAYLTHLTIYSSSVVIYNSLTPFLSMTPPTQGTPIKVLVNGNWLGYVTHPSNNVWEVYRFLKEQKYQGYFSIYTSIVFDVIKKEIRVVNDAGRLCRPVLRVHQGKLLLKPEHLSRLTTGKMGWKDLFFPHALLEYIDAEEQSFSLIASSISEITTQHTHCEIHCDTIFGILAACIPYPDHNQAPRNTYQCAMSKQAIGLYVTNNADRMDTTEYILNNTSRPLVCTRLMDILKLNQIAPGYNINVAIMTHTGFNQEDSLILNQASVDRGMFQASVYHTEKNEEKNQIHGDKQIRGIPPDFRATKGLKKGANFSKLNEEFMIPENTRVENNDVYLAKYVQLKESKSGVAKTNPNAKEYKYENTSKTLHKINEEVFIDRNYQSKNGEGYPIIKVRTRALRKPNIGDKFSSRSGQKGICGLKIPERDMPYTAQGVRADMIINPHCMPSRMTEAQLFEMLMGPILVELGLFGDGTAFQTKDFNVYFLMNLLAEMGKEQHGNHIMYDGKTGKAFECAVFLGTAFYQRLKHMVSEKIHSRATGPNVVYTRQPIDGRSRNGGLRVGEMERDAIIAHGASAFIKDRMYDVSDKYQVVICKSCGQISSYNPKCSIYQCHYCENTTNFSLIKIPYSLKLMKQELECLNISMRFLTE